MLFFACADSAFNGPDAWVPYMQRCCRISSLEFNQNDKPFWFGSSIPMTSTDLTRQNLFGPQSELPPIVFIGEPECCRSNNNCVGGPDEIVRSRFVVTKEGTRHIRSYRATGAFPGHFRKYPTWPRISCLFRNAMCENARGTVLGCECV